MPKTKLDKFSKPKAPPIDEAWGAVLCRKEQMGLSLKAIAERSGINYDYVRHLWMKPPHSWPQETKAKILDTLGLKEIVVIVNKDEEDTI